MVHILLSPFSRLGLRYMHVVSKLYMYASATCIHNYTTDYVNIEIHVYTVTSYMNECF